MLVAGLVLVLAAGLGLGLVVGLGLAELTATLVAALHIGSARLLAGFDALSGIPHARALEASADLEAGWRKSSPACGSLWRHPRGPIGNLCSFEGSI